MTQALPALVLRVRLLRRLERLIATLDDSMVARPSAVPVSSGGPVGQVGGSPVAAPPAFAGVPSQHG
jgi:hypothetical protein